jgi:transposase
VDDYQRQTTRFDEFLFALCDRMTIMDAAKLLRVNWKRAYQVDKHTLQRLRATTPVPELYAIGVDEISFKKRHRYFTLIYDLANPNGVLFAAEGRSAESLAAFFKQLPQDMRQKIQVVAMDMWEPYAKVVAKYLPQAAIVYDRFHLKKHLNECLDELRKSIVRQSAASDQSVIKGTKWVLLKNQENHSAKEQEHLEQLRQLNSPLYSAYLLKEDFDQFFQSPSAKEANAFLDNWISSIPKAIYSAFLPFIDMVKRHLSNILTYFKYRYTNSIAEGINNKIKVLKRMAYGYKDKDYFKLKIYRKCGYLKGATL